MGAKLLFEDDEGNQHEINMASIKTKGLTEKDVILAKYEIGDIQPEYREMARQALSQLKVKLEEVMPEGIKVAVVATRNGKEDLDIKILKNKAEKFKEEEENA